MNYKIELKKFIYIYMYVCVYCIDTNTYVYLTVYINW